MSFNPENHQAEGEPMDWIDDILRSEAANPGPADDGFSDRVLRALPPPSPMPHAGRFLEWINLGALVAGAALLLMLLPQLVDLLAASGDLSAILSVGSLEHVLPVVAVLLWLCWWSIRQTFAD